MCVWGRVYGAGERVGLHFLGGVSLGTQVSSRGGWVEGHPDLLEVREPRGTWRGEQRDRPVKVPVQHLLVDALEPHRLRQLGLVKVVPAERVPGQGGAFAEGGEGRRGVGRGVGVGSAAGRAPAAVRVTQDLALGCTSPQT